MIKVFKRVKNRQMLNISLVSAPRIQKGKTLETKYLGKKRNMYQTLSHINFFQSLDETTIRKLFLNSMPEKKQQCFQ